MKLLRQFIILIIALVTTLASAQETNSSEQLTQWVGQLQKTPTDRALREKIIKLALELQPAPTVPPEARRPFVMGVTYQKEAKSPEDFGLAVKAFQDASAAAPWWGDAYYNLSVALESAKRYDEAKDALTLYLLTKPTDAEQVQERLYALDAKKVLAGKHKADAEAKANSPTAKEAAKAARDEALLRSLDGVRFDAPTVVNKSKTKWETWYVINGHQLTERVRVSNPDPALQLPPSMAESSSVIPITGVHTIQIIENGSRTFEIYEDRIVIKRTWNEKTFEDICPRHKN